MTIEKTLARTMETGLMENWENYRGGAVVFKGDSKEVN